jgi:hypothetical protein
MAGLREAQQAHVGDPHRSGEGQRQVADVISAPDIPASSHVRAQQ